MKKHLSLLLLAIVAGASMVTAENTKPVKIDGLYYNLDEQNRIAEVAGVRSSGSISVTDNSLAEWSGLPAEYVFEAKCPEDAAYLGLKSVKVYADQTYIYLLVDPNYEDLPDREWVPFHVFLNTDNSDATGGFGDMYLDANTDILLEGSFFGENNVISYEPAVFKWWGAVGSDGWEWVDPNTEHSSDDNWGAIVGEGQLQDCASQCVDGKFEIKINRTFIPATWNDSEFGIGVEIEQNWYTVGILPCASFSEDNPNGKAKKLQVKIDKNESQQEQVITDLVIPATVTYENITYNVTSIGEKAFFENADLTSVVISEGVTSIEPNAFNSCSGITSLTLPNSVEYIKFSAFAGCSSLTAVTIPDGVTRIGNSAFFNCENLRSAIIGDGVTNIETGTFSKCFALNNVALPNSLTNIDAEAFSECKSLTSIVIPNDVRNIGDMAFYDCGLENIILGSNLKVIGYGAFASNGEYKTQPDRFECSIQSITCYSMRPPTVGTDAFFNMPYTTPVYVPADYLTYYQVHDIWGLYDVRSLGAAGVETEEITVEPSATTVDVTWSAVSGAATYELVIKDKQGNIICTLIFNANGQLTQIVFNAPARGNAPEQTQAAGFSFTVTGLESGTTYDLTINAKDSNDQILQTTTQTFTTGALTGVEDITTDIAPTKQIRGGQLLILLPDGSRYTATGVKL